MGFDEESVRRLILRLPMVLFALTIHEFMHAWVALKCGDDTALRAGRITLNPLAHLDPLGTICLIFGPIGWAKPVPVNRANFNYETARRDDMLVSGAGIAANFTLGVACALVLRFFGSHLSAMTEVGPTIVGMVFAGALVNFALAVFNLLPIPPLDGSHILRDLLPLNAAIRFDEFRRHGIFILLLFVIVDRFVVAEILGTSLLGYPIYWLTEVFSGIDLI